MSDTATIANAEVAADEVEGDLIVVPAGAQRQTAARSSFAGGGLSCAVLRNRIVVHSNVLVEPERPEAGQTYQIRLTDTDPSVIHASVSVDAVVRNFQIVRPA